MRFSLMYGCPPEVKGTYYVNRVVSSPTVGFTDLEEAITEAHRLHTGSVRQHSVKTYEMHNGLKVGLVHIWKLNASQRFNNQEGIMAKFTLGTLPANIDKFWVVGVAGNGQAAGVTVNTPAYDVKQEAKDEAAKLFSTNQGQKKVWLLEAVAVIDPIIPKVEWREDLKSLPTSEPREPMIAT